MRVAYRGNFQPDLPDDVTPWSTETHVAGSLVQLGHEVIPIHEQHDDWPTTIRVARGCDLFLWTSTWGFAERYDQAEAAQAVTILSEMMPTAGYHLDLWWGLDREWQIAASPFFRLGWLFTADGDHDDLWEKHGIRHHFWMPPAVFGPECVDGTPNPEWASDVAFIGSWESYVHQEHWPHRRAMLDALRDHYGDRVRFWPRPGRGAVRSENLNDLLASVKVVVGDSCMASTSRRYFSDRAFETVGRGGFLVTPWVEGLAERLVPLSHCDTFPPGNHTDMLRTVDYWLSDDELRETVRRRGQAHVREHHTYRDRLRDALAIMASEGAWS